MALTNTPSSAGGAPEVPVGGRTIINDSVVAKVVGIAARDIDGVSALGGNTARAFGAIRDAIGSTDLGQGIHVEVGEKQVAVDLTVVIDYPKPIMGVASAVRTAVTRAVTQLVGLEVTEVNITVTDIAIPSLDDDAPEERVR